MFTKKLFASLSKGHRVLAFVAAFSFLALVVNFRAAAQTVNSCYWLHEEWYAIGEQAEGRYGVGIGPAGDINGDGYDDFLVGASVAENGTETDEGVVYLFYGSPNGMYVVEWTAESNEAGQKLGAAVNAAGDVNGDGYPDVIIGAPASQNNQMGRAYWYAGSVSGLPGQESGILSLSSLNHWPSDWFGQRASSAGDINNDGVDDLLVTAPYYEDDTCADANCNQGLVSVWFGPDLDPQLFWSDKVTCRSSCTTANVSCSAM